MEMITKKLILFHSYKKEKNKVINYNNEKEKKYGNGDYLNCKCILNNSLLDEKEIINDNILNNKIIRKKAKITKKENSQEKEEKEKEDFPHDNIIKKLNIENQKIIKLSEELNKERQKVKQLENELLLEKQRNLELSNKLKSYIKMVYQLNPRINSLQLELNSKNIEIQHLKNEINKSLNSSSLENCKPGEKIMVAHFISTDENINLAIPCKNTDIFSKLEKELYDEYPDYKDKNAYFTGGETIVNRLKTMEENKIKINDKILLNIYKKK